MWIDIGVENDEQAIELGVRPGDPITFDRGFKMLADGKSILARCLDDRVGCTIMIQSIKELSNIQHEATVYAVGSVQEEVGARGATTAAYQINPDLALVYDTGHSIDPAVTPKWSATMMGHGSTIRLMYISQTGGGCITPSALKELMIKAAEETIPYQLDLMAGTLLDSSTISLSREGVPTIGIFVARRNAQSMSELCKFVDIENAVKLTVAFINRITMEFTDGFYQKLK
jgi:putative aminopeptidase FrvX